MLLYIPQFSITAMWNHVPYTTCGIIGFSAHKEPEHMSFEGE